MPRSDRHWQLIIYDVRCPRRLQKLHRFLRGRAYPLQESVFAWWGNASELMDLQKALQKRIDTREDDLRGYRLPAQFLLHLWGRSPFNEGLFDSGRPPHKHHTCEHPDASLLTIRTSSPPSVVQVLQRRQPTQD